MKHAINLILGSITMCGLLLGFACSRQEPPGAMLAPTWELQPSVAKAYYENKYWQVDLIALIDGKPAAREATSALAGRLSGVYTAVEPNGGGESNRISGFWQKQGTAGLALQITPDPGHRIHPGTQVTVTIRDSQTDCKQKIIVEIPPNEQMLTDG